MASAFGSATVRAVLLFGITIWRAGFEAAQGMQLNSTAQRQVGILSFMSPHDQEEALTMSDRIAVMNLGHLLQVTTQSPSTKRPLPIWWPTSLAKTNFVRAMLSM